MPRKPPMPCGVWFCPAPLRLLWPTKAIPADVIAACYGRSRQEVGRRARFLGIEGQRPLPKPRVYSVAEFRRLWLDPCMTKARIGARFGMSRSDVWVHAQRLGLPPRRIGAPPTYVFGPEFDAMWHARVMAREMALVYGCHATLILKEAERRGFAPRGKRGRKLTLAQFRLKFDADRTAAELRLAEMVDAPTRFARAA